VIIYMLWVQQLPILVKRILLFHHLQKGASKASADGLERQQQPASVLIKYLLAKLSFIQKNCTTELIRE
jgi:hypothetical protein